MSSLAELLSSRVKAEVFRLLFGLVGSELHVRELERRSGLSISTVRQELKRLSRLGIVLVRKDGNRTYYRANRDHPLYAEIRGLVLKTTGLVDVLRKALGQADIRVAFVFGSLAAGEEKASSDVDLMVLGPIGSRELSDRLFGLEAEVGREVNPHAMEVKEFARRRKAGDHFLTTVLAAPKLFVIGDERELAGLGE